MRLWCQSRLCQRATLRERRVYLRQHLVRVRVLHRNGVQYLRLLDLWRWRRELHCMQPNYRRRMLRIRCVHLWRYRRRLHLA
jgi:hypothetical protein